jgi:hypothetical protein
MIMLRLTTAATVIATSGAAAFVTEKFSERAQLASAMFVDICLMVLSALAG